MSFNKNKLKTIIATIFTSLNLVAYSQQPPTQSTVPHFEHAPVTPDVASLAKFGEIPVSLYTGIPSISVSLYNIVLKDKEIPISVDYHASGIKVDEVASSVGLGWSLQAGGNISCTINGKPDFEVNGWLRTNLKTPQNVDEQELQLIWHYPTPSTHTSPDYIYLTNATNGLIDTQPDLFQINLPGQSLKFVYDQDSNVYTIPQKPVSIYDKFTFTDEDDITYEFHEIDTAETFFIFYGEQIPTDPEDQKKINVTHHLSRITTPHGEEVHFIYERYIYEYKNQPSRTRYKINPAYQAYFLAWNGIETSMTQSRTKVYGKRLRLITSTRGDSIVFAYGNERLDLPDSSPLSSVKVYHRGGTNPLKEFTFFQSYFENQVAGPSGMTSDGYRLRLDSLKEADFPPYVFDYESLGLPPRLSYSQDHWGYFNGKQQTTLLPLDEEKGFNTGADRSPSSAHMKGCMLRKVSYPTGGYTEYQFEPNDVDLKVIKTHEEGMVQLIPDYEGVFMEAFTVGEGAADFEILLESSTGYSAVRILNSLQQPIRHFYSNNTVPLGIEPLPAGNYYLYVNSEEHYGAMAILTWKYQLQEAEITHERVMSGGLRVSKVTSVDGFGNIVEKHYEYVTKDGTRSSGVNRNVPVYIYDHIQVEYFALHPLDPEPVMVSYHAQSTSSLNLTHSLTGYSNVKEYTKDKEGSGYINHELHFHINTGSLRQPFVPLVVLDDMAGKPKEEIYYTYNTDSQLFFPVRKLVYEYNDPEAIEHGANSPPYNTVKGLNVKLLVPILVMENCPTCQLTEYLEFEDHLFAYTSSQVYLSAMSETIYDQQDTTKQLFSKTKYYYKDLSKHQKVTKQETTNSQGKITRIYYRYSQDIDSNYAYHSSPMVEKREAVAVDTSEYLVNAMVTSYKNIAGVFPQKQYSLIANMLEETSSVPFYLGQTVDDTRFELKKEYLYDSGNNVVGVISEGMSRTGYRWGHDNTYILATASNALGEEIFFEGFEESSNAVENPQMAHSGSRFLLSESYSLNWPLPNNRKYVLRYWRRENGQWKRQMVDFTGNYNLQGGDAYDDITIYPLDAQVTTYTYKPLVGMTGQTDPSGRTTYYEYDSSQRLAAVRDGEGNLLRTFCYNYAGQQVDCGDNQAGQEMFGNVVRQRTLRKSPCGPGYHGTEVTYTVPAGTYQAPSQQAANALALADLNANAQAYADANGQCLVDGVYAWICTGLEETVPNWPYEERYADVYIRLSRDAEGLLTDLGSSAHTVSYLVRSGNTAVTYPVTVYDGVIHLGYLLMGRENLGYIPPGETYEPEEYEYELVPMPGYTVMGGIAIPCNVEEDDQ